MSYNGRIHSKNTRHWNWPDAKYVSLGVLLITIIISLFDFNPDLYFWLIEILRNLVISACISYTVFVLSITLKTNFISLHWISFIRTILLFAIGGFLGGIIAWGINDVLFGFNVTHPGFYFIITSALSVIFGIIIFGYITIQEKFRNASARLAEKEVNEQKLILLKTKAELEALRAKVDPHFFFNTLNSIASLISAEPQKAEEMVEKMSHLFRYTLDASNQDMVKLTDELDFIKEYLDVEKVRLADRLEYSVEMDLGLMDVTVPGMLLQPLVENSIKHGISPLKGGGKINIRCIKKPKRCLISVWDSGNGFDPMILSEGFGLRGVKERLNLIYGEDSSLEIVSAEGVEIKIGIPIKE